MNEKWENTVENANEMLKKLDELKEVLSAEYVKSLKSLNNLEQMKKSVEEKYFGG